MAKPGPHGKDRQRCGARHKWRPNGRRHYCRNWPSDGMYGRCYLHGGKSTGPRTEEGKARSIAAMVTGRQHWLERMQDEGKKIPSGRKAGDKWITPAMRSREEAARHAAMPKTRILLPPRPKRGRLSKAEVVARFFSFIETR